MPLAGSQQRRLIAAVTRCCHDYPCGGGTLLYFGVTDRVGSAIVGAAVPQKLLAR
jgi:hypothetical protein